MTVPSWRALSFFGCRSWLFCCVHSQWRRSSSAAVHPGITTYSSNTAVWVSRYTTTAVRVRYYDTLPQLLGWDITIHYHSCLGEVSQYTTIAVWVRYHNTLPQLFGWGIMMHYNCLGEVSRHTSTAVSVMYHDTLPLDGILFKSLNKILINR